MRKRYFKFKFFQRIIARIKKHKIAKKFLVLNAVVFLSGVVNLLLATPVHADPFYPDGDVDGCQFATVVGVQYNSIGGSGVNWDSGNVDGESGTWIQNHHFTQVADITYPDAHRYPYIADRVAVPPNTRIEIGTWSYSYAGHGVNLDAFHLFTSRVNPAEGDLTRLGAGGTYGTIHMNGFPARSGKYITSGYVGYFPDHVSAYGNVIYSFDTIQPIQLQSFTATPIWDGPNLTVRYTAVIRNISAYNLCNIRFRDVMPGGGVYDQTFCINANDSRTLAYDESWGTSYPNTIVNDPATVWDNNWHEETQSRTQPGIYDFGDPAIRPGVVARDDLGAPSSWNANQPVWGQIERPPIIIVLIPYWFNTGQVQLDLQPELTVNKTVSDNDETDVKENDSRPDEDISYNVTVVNTGGRATGVAVTDDYDQSLINIIDSDGGADNGDTIKWDVDVLEHGESRTFTIKAKVTSPLAQGSYLAPNTVVVDSDQTPPIEDSTQTNITAEVRMEIDKTVSDSDETNSSSNHIQGAHPDNTERLSTYSIFIENSGDADAHSVVIRDDVSEVIRIGKIKEISDGGILTVRTDLNGMLTGEIVWDIGNLPQKENKTVSYTAQFKLGLPDNTQAINFAEGRTDETPPVSDVTITTIHTPILEIEKEQTLPETVSPGEDIVYTVHYRNLGSGYAIQAVIEDEIPAHTKFVEFVDPDPSTVGEYDLENNRITWKFDRLEPNTEGALSFRVVIEIPTESGTEIKNTAVIYTPVIDKIESEVITATSSSCCVGGFIWDDTNENGKYDENEKGLSNVRLNLRWGATEYHEGNEIDIFTDVTGHWEYTGLPYNTLITVKVFKPQGFDNITTPDEYKLVLLPPNENGEIEDYIKDGVRYLTASGCATFINAGIYRDVVLAQTGESILKPLSTGIGLILIGGLIVFLIVKSKKRR